MNSIRKDHLVMDSRGVLYRVTKVTIKAGGTPTIVAVGLSEDSPEDVALVEAAIAAKDAIRDMPDLCNAGKCDE